jgi:mannosyl-3-phosphoglycerate phosphatase
VNNIIIITDLDGTLLHPRTYSFKEAQPALQVIREMKIPLIFCSSKTRAEIEVYRIKLNNQHPFISENGGGIFIPAHYFSFPVDGEQDDKYSRITLGTPYPLIRNEFMSLRKRLGLKVKGFGDMNPKEIMKLTGLPAKEADLARKRDFDEPFIFQVKRENRFLRAIEEVGLQWTAGRLFHIMGNHDKGKAVDILKKLYKRERGNIQTVGLGDNLNDVPMLRTVDRPVLICHPDGKHETRIEIPGLLKTGPAGDAGWNKAVLSLLEEM